MQKIVHPVVIIDQVCAYLRPSKDGGQPTIAIHVVSDSGQSDTIIKKLAEKAHRDVLAEIQRENPSGPDRIRWVHTDMRAKIPSGAQYVYVRPLPLG